MDDRSSVKNLVKQKLEANARKRRDTPRITVTNEEESSSVEMLSCFETARFILGLEPVLTALRDKLRLSPKLFLAD